jgi:hypothetical protein
MRRVPRRIFELKEDKATEVAKATESGGTSDLHA